ncbi:uncharacterized protein LOC106640307 isoform X3 [Copidosoma floridanum]|uniref:uncharacterized protein LOC106640307 isoform X3 n=1 Tax=Copidosoma floridanum TaxID=29053 RepID=UPI0006C9DDC2|nr:uncharacterized protein LOC106640307 isoform X3 [Copidosoma floridanum]
MATGCTPLHNVVFLRQQKNALVTGSNTESSYQAKSVDSSSCNLETVSRLLFEPRLHY